MPVKTTNLLQRTQFVKCFVFSCNNLFIYYYEDTKLFGRTPEKNLNFKWERLLWRDVLHVSDMLQQNTNRRESKLVITHYRIENTKCSIVYA